MEGADVSWKRGGSRRVVAIERYGGPNVTSSSKRCVKRSRRDERTFEALVKDSFRIVSLLSPPSAFGFVVFGEDEDSDLEKYSLDVSSMGWKMIRAANEPVIITSKTRSQVRSRKKNNQKENGRERKAPRLDGDGGTGKGKFNTP